jgi:hypothetical protein
MLVSCIAGECCGIASKSGAILVPDDNCHARRLVAPLPARVGARSSSVVQTTVQSPLRNTADQVTHPAYLVGFDSSDALRNACSPLSHWWEQWMWGSPGHVSLEATPYSKETMIVCR